MAFFREESQQTNIGMADLENSTASVECPRPLHMNWFLPGGSALPPSLPLSFYRLFWVGQYLRHEKNDLGMVVEEEEAFICAKQTTDYKER